MLEKRLIEIIEDKSSEITQVWYRDLKESHYTPTMKGISEDEGMRMAIGVYEDLNGWLLPAGTHDLKGRYQEFGEHLFHRGFQLEEVVMILVLLKRYLWLALLELGLMTTNLNIYQALELNNKVVLYFDRAIYFALVGYREARKVSQRAVPSK